ncbi:TadE family type IV pilus minor pilin [Leifsonia xyli]|uniref:TadE family type IV pilus minor pilin n=1 Tax=Leifsonia xyli TaxID=1575 RepID=UPI003D66D42E
MRFPAGDRGSVSAEFAVALPAVLVCLALCVGAVHGAAQYASLAGAAAVAARLAGRGDDPAGAAVPEGAGTTIDRVGKTVCARVTAPESTVLSRLGVRLSAHACALDEGTTG